MNFPTLKISNPSLLSFFEKSKLGELLDLRLELSWACILGDKLQFKTTSKA